MRVGSIITQRQILSVNVLNGHCCYFAPHSIKSRPLTICRDSDCVRVDCYPLLYDNGDVMRRREAQERCGVEMYF